MAEVAIRDLRKSFGSVEVLHGVSIDIREGEAVPEDFVRGLRLKIKPDGKYEVSWNGGGDTGCEPTGTGFRRCFGGDGECTLPGRTCETTEDCCVDASSAIACQLDRNGERTCCLADGEECAFGDLCCGGICAPDPTDGVLRCGATCIADGGACTTAADCCGCGCVCVCVCVARYSSASPSSAQALPCAPRSSIAATRSA